MKTFQKQNFLSINLAVVWQHSKEIIITGRENVKFNILILLDLKGAHVINQSSFI